MTNLIDNQLFNYNETLKGLNNSLSFYIDQLYTREELGHDTRRVEGIVLEYRTEIKEVETLITNRNLELTSSLLK